MVFNRSASPTLCQPFLQSLPVARAAISTLQDPFDVETVCATDALAARLDELQIDLGEGPCWQALSTRSPVLITVEPASSSAWPSLSSAIAASGIHAVFAFPLIVGALGIGAVDLYLETPEPLTPADIGHAETLAGIAAMQVLNQAMERRPDADGGPFTESPYSRREVHQATGMVVAQAKVSPADALLLIRARAFADGVPVREIAAQIIERRISFQL